MRGFATAATARDCHYAESISPLRLSAYACATSPWLRWAWQEPSESRQSIGLLAAGASQAPQLRIAIGYGKLKHDGWQPTGAFSQCDAALTLAETQRPARTPPQSFHTATPLT